MYDLNNYHLWTAMVTPMLHNLEIDFASLENLLKMQENANNGILLLGSTGEALNLDLEEKYQILDFAINANLKVPLMVGIGGINLRETVKWIEHLETKKVDSYLLVTPLYAKPGPQGQYHWFKTLADISTRPIVLYNIPSRAGVALHHETFASLAEHPRIWGLKEASGSIFEFKRYRQDAPKIKIFSGDDSMMPAFASMGADGLISVASNLWPDECSIYVEQCLKMTLEDSELWKECADSLFITSNPVPIKRILHHLGIIKSPALRPPLSSSDLKSVEQLEIAHNSIQDWFREQ